MTMNELFEADPRLVDLLIVHATTGLTSGEREELDRLLAANPKLALGEFEETVAVVDQVLAGRSETIPLPIDLRRRVLDALSRVSPSARESARGVRRPGLTRAARSAGLGWAVAAAALVLLGVKVPPTWTPEPSLSTQVERSLARTDAKRWKWQPPSSERFRSVTGEVVWIPSEQRGFLLFSSLPALDPTREQYQLWIVDDATRRRHPVDGGVFDHPGTEGAVIVPFHSRLEVFTASAFAVTVEQPGGVVVSDGPLEIIATES
ncbi:MAG: anti-sigma factor [Planctomycetes bacterium]|nr:anti-sigma factor [Planctomycetota bacterium]